MATRHATTPSETATDKSKELRDFGRRWAPATDDAADDALSRFGASSNGRFVARRARPRGVAMTMTGWGVELIEPVSPERDHIRGPKHAPITLLEYGDFECPFCGAAHPVVEALRATMGQSMSFAFRHFPLTTVHPHAWQAAVAAEAAGAQNHFWGMHDLLFEDQRHLEIPDLIARARELDLDIEEFAAAFSTDAFADRIQADFLSGVRSGVQGTPTFFVNGIRYDGAPDYDGLLGAVQAVGARTL